ncbi:MAG: hypothetical protein ACT4NP_13070 [Pseudonocardiales bacterium]
MVVTALAPGDGRAYAANVAGPAALLVAKLHKLGGRQATPPRLVDKDAATIIACFASSLRIASR